jgi:hypothetical protein
VWYFAYGSNMQRATLCGRRGVTIRRAVGVRAPGWRVVFDKPPLIPIGEAFASLVPEPGAVAFGVAFDVTDDDHAHIEFSEGVLIGNYRRVELAVEPPAPCAEPPALVASLASARRDATLLPSARYMGLVIDGAREHGLPGDYVAWLEVVPTGESSAVARAFRPLADAVMRLRRS